MIYLLEEADDRSKAIREVVAKARKVEGVELLGLAGAGGGLCRHRARRAALPPRQPGHRRQRGRRWDIDGNQAALELEAADGLLDSRAYPDGLGRIWSLLAAEGAGEIVISAALGYEFVDWGGADHVSGGSHGSLRRGDSLAPLAMVNCGRDLQEDRQNGSMRASIEDVAPIVLEHFGLAKDAA